MDVKEAGSRGGKAKNAKLTPEQRNAMMAEVRASRWPKKIHTLKKPCTFPGCKITNVHKHINR